MQAVERGIAGYLYSQRAEITPFYLSCFSVITLCLYFKFIWLFGSHFSLSLWHCSSIQCCFSLLCNLHFQPPSHYTRTPPSTAADSLPLSGTCTPPSTLSFIQIFLDCRTLKMNPLSCQGTTHPVSQHQNNPLFLLLSCNFIFYFIFKNTLCNKCVWLEHKIIMLTHHYSYIHFS